MEDRDNDSTESTASTHSSDDGIVALSADHDNDFTFIRSSLEYKLLAEHFLKSGRGRRPSLPQLGNPNKKHLLQLYCLKEDGNATWETVTAWFNKLFPAQDQMTKGCLHHKIQQYLQADKCNFLDNLESAVASNIPDALGIIGFTREILLGDSELAGVATSDIAITNNVVKSLETFRNRERLPHSFVIKWMAKLCSSYSESQMRHKVSVILKKIKDLQARNKSKDLVLFLCEDIPSYQKAATGGANIISNVTTVLPKSCDMCTKQAKKMIENKKDFDDLKNQLDSTMIQLEGLQDKIKLYEQQKKVIKSLKNQLKVQTQLKEKKSARLSELKQSKFYQRNCQLKKYMKVQNREKQNLKEELTNQKSVSDEKEVKIKDLKKQLKSEQTLKARLRKQLNEKSIITNELMKADSDEKTIVLRTNKYNQFKDNIRLLYMALMGEGNVAAQNCSTVVHIVSKYLFQTNLLSEHLPSVSTILNFASEASHIAHFHVADAIQNSNHFTFATDGTSRQKKHYLEKHIVLDNKLTLSLGFSEIASDNSETLLEKTIEIFDDLTIIYHESNLTPKNQSDKDELFKSIIRKMKCLMSDRAAVMKAFDKKLSNYKVDLLGEDCSTQFLFCNAHFLLGLVNSTENALRDVEGDLGRLGRDQDSKFLRFANNKERAAVRVIRLSSDVFGPRGDEKCGCREEWLAFCHTEGVKSVFTSFRTNRFNNLFENALAIITHFEHIKKFLSEYVSHTNLKTQSLLLDVKDKDLLSLIASIALLHKFFTGPYWQLMQSQVSYGQFPPYVSKMKEFLCHCSSDNFTFEALTSLTSPFGDFKVKENALSTFMLSDKCNQDLMTRCFKQIILTTTVVFERQLADFLEGGVYGGVIDQEIQNILNSCPLTNLIGERIFGDLDFDMQKRRHASLFLRSALNMLKRNKTTSWLGKQSVTDQKQLMSNARKSASFWKSKFRDRQNAEREKIRLKIIDNMTKKREKEINKMEEKNKVLEAIISHGGLCCSKEDLDKLISGKGALMKIKAQIKYRRIMLGQAINVTGNLNTLYYRLCDYLGFDTSSAPKKLKKKTVH